MTHSSLSDEKCSLARIDLFIALFFAAIVLILGCRLIVKEVAGYYYDDGIYLTTAKAIAQSDGYRLINLPGSPIQTLYPFLYPAILALIWKVSPAFPGNLLWMQSVSLLCGAATMALAYLYMIRFRYFGRGIASAALLFCVASPSLLFFCTSCLSEMPFALLLVIAMWALDKHLEKPFTSRSLQLLVGILLLLPLFCRSIGIVSVIVLVICAFGNRRVLRLPVVGAALVAVPYFVVWTLTVTSGQMNYVSWWHSFGIPLIGRVISANAVDIFHWSTPIFQIRWSGIPGWIEIGAALIGLGAVIAVACHLFGVRKVLPLSLACYLAVVLVWPWPPSRFLVPISPYMFSYSIMVVVWVFRKWERILRPVGYGLLSILLFFELKMLSGDMVSTREYQYPSYMQLSGDAKIHWSSYEEMFNWIRKYTSARDVLVSTVDPMMYLYTSRPAFRPFWPRPGTMFYHDSAPAVGTVKEFVDRIRSYDSKYLVLTPMPGFSEGIPYAKLIVDSLRKYPGLFECVYIGKDKRFIVWKINTRFSG